MKRRYVRAVAVFAIVLVTLTGARRSGGGGCDDNGGSSSSSSGGITSGGTSTTGGGGYSSSSPSTYSPDARAEVTVTTCDYDQAAGRLKAGLSINNPSSTDTYKYSITVKFNKEPEGTIIGSDFLSATVGPGQTSTRTASSLHTFTEQTRFECEVSTAFKVRA